MIKNMIYLDIDMVLLKRRDKTLMIPKREISLLQQDNDKQQ